MQISLKWIEELLNLQKVNLNYLIEKLTLGGFEVEEIVEIELDDQKLLMLDISATANRSDSLSIKGISKEIATLLNKPYKDSKYLNKTIVWEDQFSDLICSSQLKKNYLSFLAITVENLNSFNSPKWLQQKLIQSGLRPTNNFLDFQNYILLETGYPFEVYDLNKIFLKLKKERFSLSLLKSNTNEKFLTINNSVYTLNESILRVSANELPLSLAGIIPHKDFGYSDKTNSLLIEASIFDSKFIRQQSRFLGLRTDRSARYEKSLKSNGLISAFYKLIRLLKVQNPNLICKLHTKGQILEEKSKVISLDYSTINEILGPIKGSTDNQLKYINPLLISKYLDQLKFYYSFKSSSLCWVIKIPNYRSGDINRPVDLIEEIGRLHGFNKFLTQLPLIKTIGTEDESYKARKKFTMCLLNNGFNELIHYSLTNDNVILDKSIKLLNPLLNDCSVLRSSLLPIIIKTVEENLKQGNSYIDGFECGHVFSTHNGEIKQFNEQEYISGIFGPNKTKSYWSDIPTPLSWFEAKGKIEQIFKQFNCPTYWKLYSGNIHKNILHPYRTAEINSTENERLGIFGQINPISAKKWGLSADLYLFEFNFDLIKKNFKANKLRLYSEYSLYPKIVKDLSFIVNSNIKFTDIQKCLLINGTKFLVNVMLLDEYRGLSIPEDKTSLCLQLTFQSEKKTLQTTEVEQIIKKLNELLIRSFNAKIRA
jgi:phenylalanyl-tRNA synthetase beta chain